MVVNSMEKFALILGNLINFSGVKIYINDEYIFPYNKIIFHALDKEKGFVMLQLNLSNDDLIVYKDLKLGCYDKIFIYTSDVGEGISY